MYSCYNLKTKYLIYFIFMFLSFGWGENDCPFDSLQWESKCIIFNETKLLFSDAEETCESYGGYLISIHDVETNNFLKSNIKTEFWIGYVINSGVYGWTDKSDINYTAWDKNQPNISIPQSFSIINHNGGLWRVVSRWSQFELPFICSVPTKTSISTIFTSSVFETSTALTTTESKNNSSMNECPLSSLEWKSECIIFSNIGANFSTAEQTCINLGGHLVSIHDKETNNFLTNNMIHVSFWMGFELLTGAGKWKDGSNVDYVNWDPNQQNCTNLLCCGVINHMTGLWTMTEVTGCSDIKYPSICSVPVKTFVSSSMTSVSMISTFSIFTDSSSSIPKTTPTPQISATSTTSPSSSSTLMPISTSEIPITFPKAKISSKFAWWMIILGILLFIFSVVIIILIYIRRKRKHEKEKILHEAIKEKMEAPLYKIKLSHNKRIEKQIDQKYLEIDYENILGKGSNATVYKGTMKEKVLLQSLSRPLKALRKSEIAIKLPTSFEETDAEQFVRELDALITIGFHSHIVTFLGWTLYHDIPAIITQLENITLLQHVKSFRGQVLPIKSMLKILWQISQALEHVASLMMVHRDVACRNILLTNGNTAKLADFGLCCHCDESFTYHASLQKRLPLKWLSIEALVDRIFSEKSDVWSFGILCYEIFTYGVVPYTAMNNFEMLEFIQGGNRLEKPCGTPDEIYKLMLECWKAEFQDRPTFKEIQNSLRILLENETSEYGYLTLETLKIQK